ncbi:hypothetical protein BG000_008602 [Podila horticola]|nr:hypothetical protein BG000_008602 [Podila horticola]
MRGSSILQLKSYLSSQCEDGVPGNLFRNLQFKQFNWLCREHALEGRLVTPLEQLTRSQGWKASLEPSTLAFELTSTAQAARLGSALKQSTGYFEITIQIAWEASKQELGSALLRIGECQGNIIHVDGIPLSIGTQGPLELGEIFAEFTVLHHYPRPLDRYIHLKRFQDYTCGLLLDGSSALPEIDWFGFRTALGSGIDTIIYPGIFSRYAIGHSFQVLSKTLEPYKALALKGIDLFNWKSNTWQGRLRVKNGIICGLEETVLPNKFFHPSLLEFGTLRKLVVRSALTEEKSWLFTLMDLNLGLQQLEIPAQENEMLSLLSDLCHSWNWQWKNVKVALFETGSAYKTRLSAEVVMSNSTNRTGDGHLLLQVGSDSCVGAVVDVLQWDRDHVSGYLSDSDVAILDMATDRFPSALSFFILNVSSLSHQGLLRLKSVFHKSDLGRVAIECVPFNPSCKDDIAQLLRAMNWSIIQHLSWTGEYIDDWIQLWARNGDLLADAFSASSLLRVDILGTGNTELSHLSALVIHSIIYDRPQIELNLQDVHFQDSSDLELISRALGDVP